MRWRTKFVVLVCLIGSGVLAEALDVRAAAAMFPDSRVEIGHAYKLSTVTHLRGKCSGCEDQQMRSIPNALLIIELFAEDSDGSVDLKIDGDAVFVSPVTGILKNPRLAPRPLPQPIYEEAEHRGCTIEQPTLNDFSIEELT